MLMPADAREALILIDSRNRRIGTAEKYPAHRQGLLHRAFSIFLFDAQGNTLLQRRSTGKYHSAGLWANSCCGHPRPGETAKRAAIRRLGEELNIEAELVFGFYARYRADLDRDMIENEHVYVFGGLVPEGTITPNLAEADAIKRVDLDSLAATAASNPVAHAYWLRHYLQHHRADLDALAAKVSRIRPAARLSSLVAA